MAYALDFKILILAYWQYKNCLISYEPYLLLTSRKLILNCLCDAIGDLDDIISFSNFYFVTFYIHILIVVVKNI